LNDRGRLAHALRGSEREKIEEPVAWYGPIVMNTQEEPHQAIAELRTGAFIKHL
jgi:hypothetical protein